MTDPMGVVKDKSGAPGEPESLLLLPDGDCRRVTRYLRLATG